MIIQLLGGLALIVAAFGIRDFGRSWLFAAETDRIALEAELDLDEGDDASQTRH